MTGATDKLSIIIPFYNEATTLETIVERALAVRLENLAKQIILVDDGSSDGSTQIAMNLALAHPAEVFYTSMAGNCGKGAALRRGFEQANGSVIVIQDADLEYMPDDLRQIVDAYHDPEVDAVFGSRNLMRNPRGSFGYYWGGRAVTAMTNLLFGSKLTDQPTCYKSLRRVVLDKLDLRSDGFEFCAELTAQLLRSGCRIKEVPISYRPRGKREGKKLRFRHGWRIAWTLLRQRFF